MWVNDEIDGALALQLVLARERGLDDVVRDSAGRRIVPSSQPAHGVYGIVADASRLIRTIGRRLAPLQRSVNGVPAQAACREATL